MLFIGHGLPINAIDKNPYTNNWKKATRFIPRPEGILVISAHWATKGSFINYNPVPEIIYDFKKYPDYMYKIKYSPEGATSLSNRVYDLLFSDCKYDVEHGMDHGAWSVLKQIYPKANIPIAELSVNTDITPYNIFELGTRLSPLRKEGILILGSGNIVHNPKLMDYSKNDGFNWADKFDNFIRDSFIKKDFNKMANYKNLGEISTKAFYEPSHFYPILYVAGACNKNDKVKLFNDCRIFGALSMTSYIIGEI